MAQIGYQRFEGLLEKLLKRHLCSSSVYSALEIEVKPLSLLSTELFKTRIFIDSYLYRPVKSGTNDVFLSD